MRKNHNPSLTKLIHSGFGLIVFLFILFGYLSFIEIDSLGSLTSSLFNHPLKVSNAALNARIDIVSMHRNMKNVVLAENSLSLEQAINKVKEEEKLVLAHLDVVKDSILGIEGQSLEQETREMFIAWRPIRAEVIQLVKDGRVQKAAQITKGKGADHEFLLEQQILSLASYAQNKADGFVQHSIQLGKKFLLFTFIGVIFGGGSAIIIAFYTSRQIFSSLTSMQKTEEKLKNQKQFMDNVIDSLWDTVYIFDPKTGEGIRWNKVLEEISGYNYEKERFNPPTSFYPKEEHGRIDKVMKELEKKDWVKTELNYIISDGSRIPFEYIVVPVIAPDGGKLFCAIGRDISERKQAEEDREKLIGELQKALDEIKTLSGFLPICSHCKKIRDDEGYWQQIETYISKHSDTQFSHGICKECAVKFYPDIIDEDGNVKKG